MQRLIYRRLEPGPVQVQQIDVIYTEPAQAGLARFYDMLAAATCVVKAATDAMAKLGGEHHLTAAACGPPTHDALGATPRRSVRRKGVGIGHVEERDPTFERAVEDGS